MPARPRSRPRSTPLLKLAVATALLAGSAATSTEPALAQDAGTETVRPFDIAAGPLDQALNDFGRQAQVSLTANAALTEGLRASSVTGSLTPAEALQRLLAGTGLIALRHDDGSFSLRRDPTNAGSSGGVTGPGPAGGNSNSSSDSDSGSSPTLATVVVQANQPPERVDGPVPGLIARRTRTALKGEASLAEVPQSISIVGEEEIQTRAATTTGEALRYTPGVSMDAWGADPRDDGITIRGFTYVTQLIDGMPIAGYTPTFVKERIEVLRGPASATFGPTDVGGVVNLIRKKADGDRHRAIELQFGSFSRRMLGIDLGDRLSDQSPVSWRFLGVYENAGTQFEYANGERFEIRKHYVSPSVLLTFSPRTRLVLGFESVLDRSNDNPWYLQVDGQPTGVLEGDPKFDRIQTRSQTAYYQFQHEFSDTWSFHHQFQSSRSDWFRRLVWGTSATEADPYVFDRDTRRNTEDENVTAFDTYLQAKFRHGAVSHRLLGGFDWRRTTTDGTIRTGIGPQMDVRNPQVNLPFDAPSELISNTHQRLQSFGTYIQDQAKFGERWLLTLGLRHDRVRGRTDDRLENTTESDQQSANTGRIGLTWLGANGWAPYLSWASSFQRETGVDADNHAFRPTRGRQWEWGVRYLPAGAPIAFSAALFDLRKTNVITNDPITFASRQIGEIRSRGLELEGKARLTHSLDLIGSVTLLDLSVLRSSDPAEVGKTPYLVPENTASLWLEKHLTTLPGLSVGGGVRYAGKRWNDAANTRAEKAYTLADAGIRYRLQGWELGANIDNLFDKYYVNSRAFDGYYVGNKRMVRLTIRGAL